MEWCKSIYGFFRLMLFPVLLASVVGHVYAAPFALFPKACSPPWDGWPIQARFWLEWGSSLRLADEKVNVLRHDDVSVYAKAEAAAHVLQGVLKDSSASVGREQGTAMITTESYEMALPGVLITRKAPRHALSVAC
jgi:hypothetical protein